MVRQVWRWVHAEILIHKNREFWERSSFRKQDISTRRILFLQGGWHDSNDVMSVSEIGLDNVDSSIVYRE